MVATLIDVGARLAASGQAVVATVVEAPQRGLAYLAAAAPTVSIPNITPNNACITGKGSNCIHIPGLGMFVNLITTIEFALLMACIVTICAGAFLSVFVGRRAGHVTAAHEGNRMVAGGLIAGILIVAAAAFARGQ